MDNESILEKVNDEFGNILEVILNNGYSIKGNILFNCIIPCFKKGLDPRTFALEDIADFDYFDISICCNEIPCLKKNLGKKLYNQMNKRLGGFEYDVRHDSLRMKSDDTINVYEISIDRKIYENDALLEYGIRHTADSLRFSIDKKFYSLIYSKYDRNKYKKIWIPDNGDTYDMKFVDHVWTNNELFKTFSFAKTKIEEAKCEICYEIDKNVFVELKCHHTHKFHPSCLMPWLCTKNTCPLCREKINDRFENFEQNEPI